MKKKERERVPPRRLRLESTWVMQFALTNVIVDRAVRGVHTMDLFEHYKKWLKKRGEETALNVDGFGRLFPKNFDRSMLSIDGKSRMAVRHVRVVGA